MRFVISPIVLALSTYDPFSSTYPRESTALVTVLGLLVGVNNIFIGYKFAGVSYDRLVEIVLFIFLFRTFIRSMRDSGVFRMMILVLIVFGIMRQVGDIGVWAQGQTVTLEAFARTFVKSFTYVIFFFFVFEGLKRNPVRFLHAYLLVVFAAGLLAFFQSPITPFTSEAWNIKLTYFGANIQSDAFQEGQSLNAEMAEQLLGIRVAGPYQYSIVYSYALFPALAVSVYLFLARRKSAYLFLFLFFGVVASMTLTRSLFLSAVVILIPLMSRLKIQYYILGAAAGIFLFFYFGLGTALDILLNSRLSNLTNDEGAHRNLLALCGIVAVLRFPFGITNKDYDLVRQEFYEHYGKVSIRDLPSHNGFVNLGFHFTILGYFIFLAWLMLARWYYRNIRKQVKRFFLFALLAYMAHTSFHNGFVFIGDYNVLVVLGLFTLEAHLGAMSKKHSPA
ncbi:MAG: hypothetical protein AB8F95_12535 [Bacteroidia bacterium]